ncbi:hypothetical protein M2427_003358, partial [Bradyrhizobium sp. BR13661]|nr:hypothetical protein [Bradyrhizobium sp. BR13661]
QEASNRAQRNDARPKTLYDRPIDITVAGSAQQR